MAIDYNDDNRTTGIIYVYFIVAAFFLEEMMLSKLRPLPTKSATPALTFFVGRGLNVQITYIRRLITDPSISITSIKKKGYILSVV